LVFRGNWKTRDTFERWKTQLTSATVGCLLTRTRNRQNIFDRTIDSSADFGLDFGFSVLIVLGSIISSVFAFVLFVHWSHSCEYRQVLNVARLRLRSLGNVAGNVYRQCWHFSGFFRYSEIISFKISLLSILAIFSIILLLYLKLLVIICCNILKSLFNI